MNFRLLLLLTHFLIFNTAFAVDTTSLSCLKRYFQEMEEASLPKINIHPIQNISEFLAVHGSSWEARYPGLSKKLEKIYQSFPDVVAYYRVEPNAKLKTLMSFIIRARESKSLEIEKLLELYSHDKLLESTLRSTKSRIRLDEMALEKLESKLKTPMGDEIFNPQNVKHIEMLKSYTSPIDGELGELLIAMRIGNMEARGIKYKGLFNSYEEPLRTRAVYRYF